MRNATSAEGDHSDSQLKAHHHVYSTERQKVWGQTVDVTDLTSTVKLDQTIDTTVSKMFNNIK